jgi:adenosylmethionine-8-amino-7-oxononanoate aminotransferase
MGNPAASAAALANIAIMERDDLVARSKESGAYFLGALRDELGELPIVGDVRGLGLWLAVDLTADRATKAPFTDDTAHAIMRRMREHGVLASVMGGAIELAPAYIAERTELDRAAEVIARSIREVADERGLG